MWLVGVRCGAVGGLVVLLLLLLPLPLLLLVLLLLVPLIHGPRRPGGLLLQENAAAGAVVAREARVVAVGACAHDDGAFA